MYHSCIKPPPLFQRIAHIFRICHESTVEIDFIKRVMKCVIRRAFGERNNIFRDLSIMVKGQVGNPKS